MNTTAKPYLIEDFVTLKSTIVECNAAHEREGHTNEDGWLAFKNHGLIATISCDLMDEENEIAVPARQGISPTR